MKRLVALLILVPIGIIIIAMAVANRQTVNLSLPPELGYESFPMPLFALLFATLLIGMVLGSIVTWLKQGKHRKRARNKQSEAAKLVNEVEKQKSRVDDMAADAANGEMTSQQKAFTALGLPAPSKAA